MAYIVGYYVGLLVNIGAVFSGLYIVYKYFNLFVNNKTLRITAKIFIGINFLYMLKLVVFHDFSNLMLPIFFVVFVALVIYSLNK